jgi:rod shape-determining protein MreC
VDKVAVSGLAWVQSGGFFGLTFFDDLWQDYVALRDLKEENDILREEVARLREERARLVAVLQENARLRAMLEFNEKRPDLKLRGAKVIATDVTPLFRVTRVALETSNLDFEVKPQMAVVSRDGVVGQVIEVYDGYADVMLVSDPRSRIDVITQRNRTRGMVNGKGHKGDYEAALAYLRANDEVQAGDVVVTSGKGKIFPQEVLVGTIKAVDDRAFGLHQEATVEPSVDFGRLEEVYVVTGADSASKRP